MHHSLCAALVGNEFTFLGTSTALVVLDFNITKGIYTGEDILDMKRARRCVNCVLRPKGGALC